jgi:diguanylate cyclase (GGDEF)-like protein/PAS domain S-box-containing protein
MSLYRDPGEEELNNYRAELDSLASQIQALLENTGVGIYIVQSGKFVYVNPFFEELTGYKVEDVEGTNSLNLVHPDDRNKVKTIATAMLKQQQSNRHPYEYRLIKKTGDYMWVLERVSPIEYMGMPAVIGSFMDINERKLLEQALSLSEERYRTILETMQDSYYEVDLAGNYSFANPSNCLSMGYTMEELIGTNYRKLVPEDEVERIFAVYNEVYRTGKPNRRFEHKVVRKDGTIAYSEAAISLLMNKQGKIVGFRSVGRDVTDRKLLEQKLADMATKDFLTGLANRTLLSDRFQIAEAQTHRTNQMVAVMSLDLDRFKAVNDTLGHDAGDKLLKGVAGRLKSAVRATDTVARMGGDEFLLLLTGVHGVRDASCISQKIMDCFEKPFEIDGANLKITTSVGVSLCPDDGSELEMLMKKSDAAMYVAKNSGRNQFKLHCDCPG